MSLKRDNVGSRNVAQTIEVQLRTLGIKRTEWAASSRLRCGGQTQGRQGALRRFSLGSDTACGSTLAEIDH